MRLLNIPEPVAAADTDFNRAITLEEFRQAAIERFQLLDRRTKAGSRSRSSRPCRMRPTSGRKAPKA